MENILVLFMWAFILTLLGIAESVCYGIYKSGLPGLLPLRDVLIPIIGGGPVHVLLLLIATILWIFYENKPPAKYFYVILLIVQILIGLVIPSVSLALNLRSSSDEGAITKAFLALPPDVAKSYATKFQSCTYNIPANDTRYSLSDIAPEYIDKNCPFRALPNCTVPVWTCNVNEKSLIPSCGEVMQLFSPLGPCNTLSRVTYQVKHDWDKLGEIVDAICLALWPFWWLAIIIIAYLCNNL